MTSDTKQIADFTALSSIKAPEPIDTPVRTESWPDRTPHSVKIDTQQISVRAPTVVISKLQRLCKEERYTYGEMLGRLLEAYEGRGR